MNIDVSFRHVDTDDFIREYAVKKSQKFNKYFRGKVHVDWHLDVEKKNKIAHCHLLGKTMDYFGEAKAEDFRESIDLVMGKLMRQVRRKKEKVKDHLHHRRNANQSVFNEFVG